MRKIKVVTDSTCDLSLKEATDLHIHVIPLSISIDGETFLDRVELSPAQFMARMGASAVLPKSSQPAVGEFVKLYDELGSDGSEILSLHMTGKLSGTAEAARSASEMTETKVTVIDSLYISRALAFQAKAAAELAEKGASMDEIVERINRVRDETRLYLVVNTLENLVKGGRIGKAKAMIGSLLNIKPIAMLEHGELTAVTKVRSQTQAIKYLIKEFMEDVKGKTIKQVAISHADALELATSVKHKIEELTGFLHVEISEATPVISTHTGAGAIGFMYYAE